MASRLGLAEGEAAAVRRRIQFVDDEPSALADSYYPLALVKDTEIVEPADIERGANRVLEEIGHGQVRFMDEIVVRMPGGARARSQSEDVLMRRRRRRHPVTMAAISKPASTPARVGTRTAMSTASP